MLNWFSELTPKEKHTLGVCFGGWTLDQLDVQMYSFVVPALMVLWNVSPAQAGALGTATLLISAVGGWLGGALADRYGRVRMLQLTILWFAFFTFLCGFAQSFDQLFVFRALQGFGFGGEWGIGSVLLGEVVRDKYRGRTVGLLQTGASVGWGAAALLFVLISALLPEQTAWRVLFWVGILPAGLVFWIRRAIEEPKAVAQQSQRSGLTQIFAVLKPPHLSTTLRVSLLATGAQGGFYALNFWLPTYLKTVRHLSSIGTGTYVFVGICGAFCGFLTGAFLGDAIGRKRTFAVSAIGSLVMTAIYMFVPFDNFWILPVGFILGWISLMMFAPMGAFMTELYPASVRATGQGFCYNAGRGFGALFPALAGVLASNLGLGPAVAIFTLGAYGLMIVAVLMLPETKGVSLAELDNVAAN